MRAPSSSAGGAADARVPSPARRAGSSGVSSLLRDVADEDLAPLASQRRASVCDSANRAGRGGEEGKGEGIGRGEASRQYDENVEPLRPGWSRPWRLT